MRTLLPTLSATILVFVAGVVHGSYTGRWGSSKALENALDRLHSVPATFGDWHGEPHQFDEQDLRRAGIKGHAAYRYKNTITGDHVTMLIVCGRPGPISAHTPDVCYTGAGFRPVGEGKTKDVTIGDNRTISLQARRFKSPPSLGAAQIEVSWAWNTGKGWLGTENARFTFALAPALYKIYVVRDVSALATAKDRDPSQAFLQTFLPELEKILAN